jgi:hypothetical protein
MSPTPVTATDWLQAARNFYHDAARTPSLIAEEMERRDRLFNQAQTAALIGILLHLSVRDR